MLDPYLALNLVHHGVSFGKLGGGAKWFYTHRYDTLLIGHEVGLSVIDDLRSATQPASSYV